LSENPTAQELFAAKQGEVPDAFTFGGHEWTAGTNDKGEKVWLREDGKITYEWASLYGGGRYNAYMFVTRSERVEGKSSVEIYADPRSSYFYIITGSPNVIDGFVGTTVADYLQGAASKAALKQPGSTLRIISGGVEYWPVGGSSGFKPQDINYFGPNGESLWQKIWGIRLNDFGYIGPFVEPGGTAVQCGVFQGPDVWFNLMPQWLRDNPAYTDQIAASDVAAAIRYCSYFDPKKKILETTPEFGPKFVMPIVKTELINVK
jgi:hypothetical protein